MLSKTTKNMIKILTYVGMTILYLSMSFVVNRLMCCV